MAAVPAPDTPGGPNFLRWLQFRVSGSTFECPSVYQLVKPIGKGGAQRSMWLLLVLVGLVSAV